METTIQHLHKFKNRTLWFDGDSSYTGENLEEIISKFDVKYVDSITPQIEQFNKFVPTKDKITVKAECRPLEFTWNIPKEYLELDVSNYVITKLIETNGATTEIEFESRTNRVIQELELYNTKGLFPFLRAVIYIINTLNHHNVVWGVGRGSSVASYVLYLIGVHDVDSYTYELNINEFLHD